MKRMHLKKENKKRTMNIILFVVFFCLLGSALLLSYFYTQFTSNKATILVNQKLDKVMYRFFNDLITDEVINKDNINNILDITKNREGEILAVSYDLEKTYAILTKVANILEEGLNDLENGLIDITLYDKYLESKNDYLVLYVPLFLGSKNIFISNFGPKIPLAVNFNESILTNVKTKVTNYGFNNALLEVYITVEMQKLLITPVTKDEDKFNYDILIASLVVNGSVPDFYEDEYEAASAILDIPIKLNL